MPTVSSFPPEYLELFREAAQRERYVGPLNKKQANRLRFQLNSLRQAMRKEEHELVSLAERVKLKIEERPITTSEDQFSGFYIVATSEGDDDLVNALRNSGITIPDLDLPAPASATPEDKSKRQVSSMESVLSSFLAKE